MLSNAMIAESCNHEQMPFSAISGLWGTFIHCGHSCSKGARATHPNIAAHPLDIYLFSSYAVVQFPSMLGCGYREIRWTAK